MGRKVTIVIDSSDIGNIENKIVTELFCDDEPRDVSFDVRGIKPGLRMFGTARRLQSILERHRVEADKKISSAEIWVSSRPLAVLANVVVKAMRPSHPTTVKKM